MILMSSKVKIGSASRSSTDLSYFNREVKHRAQPPARGGRASAARRDRRWASRSSRLRRWRPPSGSALSATSGAPARPRAISRCLARSVEDKAGARDSARVHCPDSQALTATTYTKRRSMSSAVIQPPCGDSPREVQSSLVE